MSRSLRLTLSTARRGRAYAYGHSTIQVGSDKPVGLVPNSAAQAAGAVAIQAEEQQAIGVPLPQSVPGHIETSDKNAQAAAIIYVTPAQANAMRGYINDASSHPQRYDAVYHNCAEFSEGVLGAGGIRAPRDITPGGLVNDLSQ